MYFKISMSLPLISFYFLKKILGYNPFPIDILTTEVKQARQTTYHDPILETHVLCNSSFTYFSYNLLIRKLASSETTIDVIFSENKRAESTNCARKITKGSLWSLNDNFIVLSLSQCDWMC